MMTGLLETGLATAGRFRPTGRLAARALQALRRRDLLPRQVTGALNGRRILLNLDEDIDAKIFLYGAFDERGLRLIKRLLVSIRCRTILDIGANIGSHTGFFCDWAERVYAFELNPPVAAQLAAFVRDNAIGNIEVMPYGLSDRDGKADIYTVPGASGLTTLNPASGLVRSGAASIRRGDTAIDEVGIVNIDAIKIDVEGHEYEVLSGLRQTIARHRPLIIMEFLHCGASKFRTEGDLADLLPGYTFHGTGKGLLSRLFKSALRLEPFVFGRPYDHLICVPERLARQIGKRASPILPNRRNPHREHDRASHALPLPNDLAKAADQPARQRHGRTGTAAALTVVHVSGFPTGIRPHPHHSVELKLSNGLTRLGHLALNFSDRDVARAKSITGSRKFGRAAVNSALVEFCSHHHPDLLLLGHADMISARTVLAIRDRLPRLRVGQWNVDPLFEPDNVARIEGKLPVVDATFVSTAGAPLAALRAGGHPVSFMPNPADPSIERGRADLRADLPFDLFYACGYPGRATRHVCGQDWPMEDFIRLLAARLPQMRLQLGGILGRPVVKAAAYQAALEQSAVGLNISKRPDHPLYSSDRIAQLAANGCVVAIERGVGYGDYFGDDAMLFFDSIDELAEGLARMAAEPQTRMLMASRGRSIYLDRFNERRVAAHLLSVLWDETAPEAMPW